MDVSWKHVTIIRLRSLPLIIQIVKIGGIYAEQILLGMGVNKGLAQIMHLKLLLPHPITV